MGECDIDDILCQMRILDNLKNIKDAAGTENFKKQYPELEGLETTIASRIDQQDEVLRSAFEKCNLPYISPENPADIPEIPVAEEEES